MTLKILIVKTSALGDIVHALPLVAYLKAKYPQATIDWVVEKGGADLIKAHPLIDRSLVVDTKRWRKNLLASRKEMSVFIKELKERHYDVLFDLQGNTKSAFITFFAKANVKVGFGRKSVPEFPNLLVTNVRFDPLGQRNVINRNLSIARQFFKDDQPWTPTPCFLKSQAIAQSGQKSGLRGRKEITGSSRLRESSCGSSIGSRSVLNEYGPASNRRSPGLSRSLDDPVISLRPLSFMICFGSRWENKKLSLDVWKEFLLRIVKEDQVHIVYGSAEEKMEAELLLSDLGDRATLLPPMSLPLWQNTMGEMDGVIAVDSVGLHLAGLAGVATFSFFGPSSSSVYQPFGKQHVSIQGSCPYGLQFDKRCPRLRTCKSGACLKQMNVEDLWCRFQEWRSACQNRCVSQQDLQLL